MFFRGLRVHGPMSGLIDMWDLRRPFLVSLVWNLGVKSIIYSKIQVKFKKCLDSYRIGGLMINRGPYGA